MDYAAVMNSCDRKFDQQGLASLAEAERVVALVSRANFEIELGGISSFYSNSAGDYAVETVAALDAIHATGAASALREANSMFQNSPPQDREQRLKELQAIFNQLGSLDNKYYAENPDVFSRLCAYIDDHAAELSEHLQPQ